MAFREMVPCLFGKESRSELLAKKGIENLQKEFDIVRFIKKARIAHALGSMQLTPF